MPIYMKYEGIDGNVTAKGHEKWIEINSAQWGVGRGISGVIGRTADREASTPSVSEFVITKLMDETTPKLFTESVVGTGKKVEFHLCTTGDNVQPYMEYILTDCMISGMSTSSGGDRPSESLSLNFTKIEMKYKVYDKGGKVGTQIPAMYDLTTAAGK